MVPDAAAISLVMGGSKWLELDAEMFLQRLQLDTTNNNQQLGNYSSTRNYNPSGMCWEMGGLSASGWFLTGLVVDPLARTTGPGMTAA